jgi:hypothetical protein
MDGMDFCFGRKDKGMLCVMPFFVLSMPFGRHVASSVKQGIVE